MSLKIALAFFLAASTGLANGQNAPDSIRDSYHIFFPAMGKDILSARIGGHSYKIVNVYDKPSSFYVDDKLVPEDQLAKYADVMQRIKSSVRDEDEEREMRQMERDRRQAERDRQQAVRDREQAVRDREQRQRERGEQEIDRAAQQRERDQQRAEQQRERARQQAEKQRDRAEQQREREEGQHEREQAQRDGQREKEQAVREAQQERDQAQREAQQEREQAQREAQQEREQDQREREQAQREAQQERFEAQIQRVSEQRGHEGSSIYIETGNGGDYEQQGDWNEDDVQQIREKSAEDRAMLRKGIQVLVDDHIIDDSRHLKTLVLTDTDVSVNGVKQPANIYQEIRSKLGDWAHNGFSYGATGSSDYTISIND